MQLHKSSLTSSRSWQSWIGSFLLILVAGLIAYRRIRSTPPELLDFYNAYYPAGKMIFKNPDRLYSFAKSIILGFVNLPIIAYLLTPFSVLDEYPAGVLFTLMGVGSAILSGWLLIKLAKLSGWRQTIFILLLLINTPIYYSLWLGNSTQTVFLFVIASFLCFRLKRDVWSGVFLAIAGLLKIPLLFPILYFVLRKRWQVVKGFFATLVATFGLSVIVCGLNLNLTWFKECILAFSGKVVTAYNVQSVDSFVIRLVTNAPIDTWEYTEGSWLFKLLRYSLFLILIGGTLLVMMRARQVESVAVENLEFSSFFSLALLVSPISWTHYYLVLLLPIALYLGGQLGIPTRWTWTAAMALSILLLSAPNVRNVPFSNPVLAAFTRHFLVSHFFWGGVLFLSILLATRWRLGLANSQE